MRGILDYGIGIAIVLFGIGAIVRDQFNLKINETVPPNNVQKIFGGICILYGGWRIYRGYKKNYFQ